MRNGAEYRAYIVGRDGHFLSSKEFVAENDDDALEHARRLVDGHDVELWSGERVVAKLKSPDKPASPSCGFSVHKAGQEEFYPGTLIFFGMDFRLSGFQNPSMEQAHKAIRCPQVRFADGPRDGSRRRGVALATMQAVRTA
jgi:hypothetical protein